MNRSRTTRTDKRILGALLAAVLLTAACREGGEQTSGEPPAPVQVKPGSSVQSPEGTGGEGTPSVTGRVGTPADWCAGHQLPESMCTKCNPGLIKRFKESGDWCAAHGFPESACPSCNPVTAPRPGGSDAPAAQACADNADDWCEAHRVPESLCTRCNASLIPAFKATGDWCAAHGLPESQCLRCNPKLEIKRPKRVEGE